MEFDQLVAGAEMASPISGGSVSLERQAGFFAWVTQLVHKHRVRLSRLVVREGPTTPWIVFKKPF